MTIEVPWSSERAGPPPMEHAVPFPIERYPDILDDYDPDSFGIAFKLGGTALPGEETIINAFFALWLSVYQDERVEELLAHDGLDACRRVLRRGATPAQVALAWILSRGRDIVPIPGTRRRTRLDENLDSLALALGPEDLADLEPLASRMVGERYVPSLAARVER